MNKRVFSVTLMCILAIATCGFGQISVNSCNGKTAQEVVEEFVKGNGVKISNAKFNGTDDKLKKKQSSQLGTFTNNEKKFPVFFSSGIIICTGNCKMAEGPNDHDGKTSEASPSGQKCKELEKIVKPYPVNFPAVLEFDFSSVTQHVQFRYVFASEEYPEYSCSQFNDVFGFFVTDTKTGKTENIALIPGTKDAVSVNNIHPDYDPDNCKGVNEQYLTMLPKGSPQMQFDGYVGPFEAVVDLEPNRTYHMKLAISNVSDMRLESAVFIEAMSFNAVDEHGFVVGEGGKCPVVPNDLKIDTLPERVVKGVPYEELKKGYEFGILIEPSDYKKPINLDDYDITLDPKYDALLDTVAAEVRGDSIYVMLRLRGDWCNCFSPEKIPVDIILTPKSGSDGEMEQIVIPRVVPIVDRGSWFSRCLWVLITIAALLLFVFYLRALLKKNRFKKSARIDYTYMETRGSMLRETDLQNGIKLREKTFLAWVKRWLVPFRDERRFYNWRVPSAGGITFVASRSREWVYITKESFNPRKMRMGDYDPKENEAELVEMADDIKVYQNGKYQGHLEYNGGGKNDEKYYRIIITVLMALSIAAILVLTFLMLRGILG